MRTWRLLFYSAFLCFLSFVGPDSGASASPTKKGRFELIMSESAGLQQVEFIDFQMGGYEYGARDPSFLFLESESVRRVVGQLSVGNLTKSFVVFSRSDKAPIIWMRLKSLEELEMIKGLLSESSWSDGHFNRAGSEHDQEQAQVAEKSLPPTEGELYAQLDFGDFVLEVKPGGWRLSIFKSELRGWQALEVILNAAKGPLKVNFLMSSVLRDRITRGLDLDTNQRIQFKKFFVEGEGNPKDFNFYEEAANRQFHGISDTSYIQERENAGRSDYEKRTSVLGNRPIFEIFYLALHLPGNQKKPVLGFFRVYPGSVDLHLILDEHNRSDGREIANELSWLASFSISRDGKATSPGMERAMVDLFPKHNYVLGFSFPLHRKGKHQLITVEREAADIMTAVLKRHGGVLVEPKALEDLRKGSLNEYEAYVHERLRIAGPDERRNPLNQNSGRDQICRLQLIRRGD